jgi:hypothetical protein
MAFSVSKPWTLTSGDGLKTVYVQLMDAAGNPSIVYNNTIILDVTAPTLMITLPTSSSTHSTSSSTINLGGNASDNIVVTSVTWSNAATGESGTASGTTSWSMTGISLIPGSNIITVTAHDAAGNNVSATITVTYTPQQIPEFGAMPLVVIVLLAMVVLSGETKRKRRLSP